MNKSNVISLLLSQGAFLTLLPIFPELFTYLNPMVVLVIWVGITFLVTFFVYLLRGEHFTVKKSTLLIIFFLYSVGLFVLLFLRPNDASYGQINLTPFSTVEFYLSGRVGPLIAFYNIAANIVLFMPYGILARLCKLSFLKMLFLATVSIVSIEILQFISKRGSMDIDDLILNVFGVFIGSLLYTLFKKVVVTLN